MGAYGAPALVELWVSRDAFSRASGLLPRTITGYVCQGRIKARGGKSTGKVREFRLDEKYRKYPVGDIPKIINEDPQEMESISGKKMVYPTDKRLKNLAWLANKCFMDGGSFSVALNKIIGEHRESL